MAKGNRGGKRTGGSATTRTQQAQQAQQQPVQTMSDVYNQFSSMSDDQKADTISTMISQDVPDHLANNSFQKLIYNMDLNDKPDLVDDATLDSMSGTEIFRTVNNVYDRQHDISYSADQIAKQVQSGSVTRVSDNGGSVYGRGIYFADNQRDSSMYGNTHGNVKKTAQIRAKLNDKARVIDYNSAVQGCSKEMMSGSKLGKALKKCDNDSRASIWALAKGYNVISSGNYAGYYNILNRQAVTISKSIKPI